MFYYNLILNILFMPLAILFILLSLFNFRLRTTLIARLGFNKIKSSGKSPVWFHCSSVGEFNAIRNVIINLKKKYDNIFITTLTDTGYNTAVKTFKADNVSILPLDFNFLIKRFIKKIAPKILVIEETEIWPNLIFQAQKMNIPVLYTNCIISEKSFKSYNSFGFIFKNILRGIDAFFIQNESTKRYLLNLGIAPGKIRNAGNIKFDLNSGYKKNAEKIKKSLNLRNKFIITAGSTRKGEEKILLNVFKELRAGNKDISLILVPRHLDRVNDIIELIEKYGFKYSLYSKPVKDYDILLVDKMGVLIDMYFIGNISFIGGTMVPVGGHNPLESAVAQKPILCGKYIKNNKESFLKILENKGGFMINSELELLERIKKLIDDPKVLSQLGKNAYKVLKENQGASQKIVQYLMAHYIYK